MGGSSNPAVHATANLLTLCRSCHANLHEGRWTLEYSPRLLRVLDVRSGEQVMRRYANRGVDVPTLFNLLNLSGASVHRLQEALRYLTDEELVEAFGFTRDFGKQIWLVQAALLYEAQARSIYGDEALAAVARRFEISPRQAQKYALVWKTFFAQQAEDAENVNIDAFILEEPSWFVVAASETDDPHMWLGYAQDRKLEDPRYTVAALRRDIRASRLQTSIGEARAARHLAGDEEAKRWECPWIRIYCTRSGRPVPVAACQACAEQKRQETKAESGIEGAGR